MAALIDKKAKPDEAQGFKQWLVAVTQKVAEAAKEGGFLGFGGTQVSEQEARRSRKCPRPSVGSRSRFGSE